MENAVGIDGGVVGESPVGRAAGLAAEAEAEAIAAARRAPMVEGEKCLLRGAVVVVNLHGAVAAAAHAGVAEIVGRRARIRHARGISRRVVAGPKLDVSPAQARAGDDARDVRDDVEVCHILLERRARRRGGHADFSDVGGERVHRGPDEFRRGRAGLEFEVIGDAGEGADVGVIVHAIDEAVHIAAGRDGERIDELVARGLGHIRGHGGGQHGRGRGQDEDVQDAARIRARIGGEGPVHAGVDRGRVVANADIEGAAVGAEIIHGQHGLRGGGGVVVNLHAAVARAGEEGVAEIESCRAGVRHAERIGLRVVARPKLDVAAAGSRAIDHARDIREDAEIRHVLLEHRARRDRGDAELRLVDGEGIHRRPHVLHGAAGGLQFEIIGDAAEGSRCRAFVESIGAVRGVEIARHGEVDGSDELIAARRRADIGDDLRRQRGGADGDAGAGDDEVRIRRTVAHAADRERERRACGLGGGEQLHVALIGRERRAEDDDAAVEREVLRQHRRARERLGKMHGDPRASGARRGRGERGPREIAARLHEHLQRLDRVVAGVIREGPVHAVVHGRGVVADAEVGVHGGQRAAPIIEAENRLARAGVVELHRAVSAGRGLVAEVEKRVARARHARRIRRRIVHRPEFEIPRQPCALADPRHIRDDIHPRHALLEHRARRQRGHADFPRVRRERIHRRPHILQVAARRLQLQIIRDARERPDAAAVVHGIRRIARAVVRDRRNIQRAGECVARGFRHVVEVAAWRCAVETDRAVGRQRKRAGGAIHHAIHRRRVARGERLLARGQSDRAFARIEHRRRDGEPAAEREISRRRRRVRDRFAEGDRHMRAIRISHRPHHRRHRAIALKADDCLDRGQPRIRHVVVARLARMQLIRHLRQRHRRAHVEESDAPPERRLRVHPRLHVGVELRLDRRVLRLIPLHEIRHNDVREGPQRRHLRDERIKPVDRVRRVHAQPEIIRADVQQDHVRVGNRAEPSGDVRVELPDGPPAVPLVIRIRQRRHAIDRLRADEIHVVARRREHLVELVAIAAGQAAVGDGIAQRHDPHRRRLRRGHERKEQRAEQGQQRGGTAEESGHVGAGDAGSLLGQVH